MRSSCFDAVRLLAVLLLPTLCSPIAFAQDTPDPAATSAETAAPASEADPPQPDDLFTQGRNAMFQGRYARAIDLLGRAVAADETKTSYRLHLARAYRYAGKNDDAATQLKAILEKAPDHVEAGQALGEIHSAAQRWKDVVLGGSATGSPRSIWSRARSRSSSRMRHDTPSMAR